MSKGLRLLVTGGAGFIGSHIVAAALTAGYETAIVDDLSTGNRRNVPSQARFFSVDITDAKALEHVFAVFRPHYVAHHAAQIDVRRSVEDAGHDAAVNILGTINVLEAARRHGVRKVTYASSAAVYGNPTYLPVDEAHPIHPLSPYGASKHTVEHYLEIYRELYDLAYVVLRYSNVYGPRQNPNGDGGVIAIFTARILHGDEITIFGDGEQTRDFVYVGDVARANLLALSAPASGIVNISGQHEISVNALYKLMSEVAGMQVKSKRSPERPGEIRRSILANAKANELLGWTPAVSLREGIERTFAAEKGR
jgi:UDP-glucose 4-epimerase